MPIDDAGEVRDRFPPAPEGSASSSRRRRSPRACRVDALADDGVVVPGQPVKVNVIVANRGAGEVAIKQVEVRRLRRRGRLRDDRVHRRRLRLRRRRARRRGGATAPPAQPMSTRREGSGRALRADVDDSGGRARRPSRTGTARARPAATPSTPTRRSACRCGRRRSTCRSTLGVAGRRRGHRRACRCSIATRATSSAARSGPSCWSCRRCRCGSRRRLRSSRRRRGAAARAVAPAQRRARAAPAARRAAQRAAAGAAAEPRPPCRPIARFASRSSTTRRAGGKRRDARAAAGLDGVAGRAAGDVRAGGRIADGAVPGQAGADAPSRASITSSAIATANGQTFDRGFQVIEYPHIRRYHIYDDGATRR